MTTPQTQTTVIRANRILLFVGAFLFALASLAIAFGWDVNAWALGFGGFAAWCLSGAV